MNHSSTQAYKIYKSFIMCEYMKWKSEWHKYFQDTSVAIVAHTKKPFTLEDLKKLHELLPY